MNPLNRTEQISKRTLLFETKSLNIRYRKNLKYLGLVKTKSSKSFHLWKDNDIVTNVFLMNNNDEIFRLFKNKLIPLEKYEQIFNK